MLWSTMDLETGRCGGGGGGGRRERLCLREMVKYSFFKCTGP